MNENNSLTPADFEQISNYLRELDEITKRRPAPLPDEIWEKALPIMLINGDVPTEYKEYFGMRRIKDRKTGESTPAFYEIALERWNDEIARHNEKYQDLLVKVLRNGLSGEQTNETIQLEDLLRKAINKNKVNPRSKAIEKGALMSLGGHVAAYSDYDLRNALNGFSIFRLPSTMDIKNAFDQKGMLNMLLMQQIDFIELDKLQSGFLYAVVLAVDHYTDYEKTTVTLYLPEICREMKIDPRTYSSKRNKSENSLSYAELRLNAMLSILAPFDPLVGRTPDGSYYRLLTFESYDKESESLTVDTPYLFKLKEITSGKTRQLQKLLHSDVANEPNTAAVELASRILIGIVDRGVRTPDSKTSKAEQRATKKTTTKTDKNGQKTTTTIFYDNPGDEKQVLPKTFTYTVKYSTLVNECPQLKKELEDIEIRGDKNYQGDKKIARPAQAYNKKLQDVFNAAYRIITEKSDAPARYIDFELPKMQRTIKGKSCECFEIPTKSTLNRKMVITHKGKNPRFI